MSDKDTGFSPAFAMPDSIDLEALQEQIRLSRNAELLQRAQMTDDQAMRFNALKAGDMVGTRLGGGPDYEDPRIAKTRQMQEVVNSVAHLAGDPGEYLKGLSGALAQAGLTSEAAKMSAKLYEWEQRKEIARLRALKERGDADPIKTLINSGRYTEASVKQYLLTGDPEVLQLKPTKFEIKRDPGSNQDMLIGYDKDGNPEVLRSAAPGTVTVQNVPAKQMGQETALRGDLRKEVQPNLDFLRGAKTVVEAAKLATSNPTSASITDHMLASIFREGSRTTTREERVAFLRRERIDEKVIESIYGFLTGKMTRQRVDQILEALRPHVVENRDSARAKRKAYKDAAARLGAGPDAQRFISMEDETLLESSPPPVDLHRKFNLTRKPQQ